VVDVSRQQALELWRNAVVASVKGETPDLSQRQMAVMLTVYMSQPPHTVRGLAELLNISKPAVTRALDRLSSFGLVKRKVDDNDRRSVLVQRTVKGSVFLSDFAAIVMEGAKAVEVD
jgi:DNA-binding MarR family transcriptional regulator